MEKEKRTEFLNWVEVNNEMVELLLQDFQEMQRRLYQERLWKK